MAETIPPEPDDEAREKFFAELRKRLRDVQNRIAEKVGVSGRDRVEIVSEMLSRHQEDRVSYWLRILLALGISTLGLVLNSTGVVIGAMLISPLMEPIVALGMGLAVGSPYLTLRASVRLSASVVIITLAAALLIVALPFHTMTPEIQARTSPTLIDLSIAGFCALAAGFTTVRRSSDTAAAAAGTAIGIALVPPVCVIGYGLGVGRLDVAGGASLLFTANLCAIVFVNIALFLGLGFNYVDIRRLESTQVRATGRVARIASRLRRTFSTRYGDLVRFLMPAGLVAGLFFPLRTALSEVAWKVRVQGDVEQALSEAVPAGTSVRSAVSVEGHAVQVRLVIVGSPRKAREIEGELRTKIAAAAGVVPSIEVLAVPDHETLAAVARSASPAITEPVAALAPAPTRPNLERLRAAVEGLVAEDWPPEAGEVVTWHLSFDPTARPRLTLMHTGDPLGPVGKKLLANAVADLVDTELEVIDEQLELGTWEASPDDVAAWLPDLSRALAIARSVDGVRACVTKGPLIRHIASPVPKPAPAPEPSDPAGEPVPARPAPAPAPVPDPGALAAEALLAQSHPRVEVSEGSGTWAVALTQHECPSPPSSPEPTPPDPPEPEPQPQPEPAPVPAPQPVATTGDPL